MRSTYATLVRELLNHLNHVKKRNDPVRPIYIYIKSPNFDTFASELSNQFKTLYPGLLVKSVSCIEHFVLKEFNTYLFVINQPTTSEGAKYIRYETVVPTIIFNDMF